MKVTTIISIVNFHRLFRHLSHCRIAASIVLTFLSMSDTSLAQRLMIETPSTGPSARFFYGQIGANEFRIFEKKIDLELDAEAQPSDEQQDSNKLSPLDNPSSGSVSRTTVASMQIRAEDLNQCLKSARVSGFLALISTMKGKVNSAKILAGPDADSCAKRISQALERNIGPIAIANQSSFEPGIKVELALQSTVARPIEKPQANDKPPVNNLTLDQIISLTRMTIDGKRVSFNDAGWFALEVQSTGESVIELKVPGRKKITINSFPITLTKAPRLIGSAGIYNSVLAVFSQKALKIYISDIPFLVQKTTIDGGAGGGLGYGREVPGERRGERLVSMLGIEKRQLWGQFGIRANLLYTNASKTVVPHTFTFRGTGFYDYDFEDESLVLRSSVGTELFHSSIKDKKNQQVIGSANKDILIPSQVLSPIIGLSLYKIFKNGILLTPAVHVAPLYISAVGFYPSVSPSLDVGYKIKKDLFATLSAGSEVHRFPSELGETKLQMDYLTLTFKRGLL